MQIFSILLTWKLIWYLSEILNHQEIHLWLIIPAVCNVLIKKMWKSSNDTIIEFFYFLKKMCYISYSSKEYECPFYY